MQRVLCSLFVGLVIGPLSLATAQSTQPAAASPSSVATINFSAAVMQTNEAQKSFAALKQKYASREAQLKSLGDEVDTLKKQLEAAGGKLSDAEGQRRALAIDQKNKQLQREEEDYKSDSQSDTQQAFQAVAQKVFAFLQTYAGQKHYTAVIERGSPESPIVWYADPSADITNDVVRGYNAQSGSALPAAPGAAARTPPGE